MTWNTEGHEPIPQEEALPQLGFVASAMMMDGIQEISRPRLSALLHEARESLTIELGHVQGSVEQFIDRIEDRSSLLMMSGMDVEAGQLVQFFEFRHLTFQEFLAAMAVVKGWYRGRDESDSLLAVLEQRIDDEAWREVIPLAAVLGERQTELLIKRMTKLVQDVSDENWSESPAFLALGNCLADDAAASPATLSAAIHSLVRLGLRLHDAPFARMLALSRYGSELLTVSRERYEEACSHDRIDSMTNAMMALATTCAYRNGLHNDEMSWTEHLLGRAYSSFIGDPTGSSDRWSRRPASLMEESAAAWASVWLLDCPLPEERSPTIAGQPNVSEITRLWRAWSKLARQAAVDPAAVVQHMASGMETSGVAAAYVTWATTYLRGNKGVARARKVLILAQVRASVGAWTKEFLRTAGGHRDLALVSTERGNAEKLVASRSHGPHTSPQLLRELQSWLIGGDG